MAKEFYQLIRSFGGISLEYTSLSESDFSAAAGAAYTPPERGDFRRIAGSRQIQLLSDIPGVVETFHTTAIAEIFLPANTVADNTNDAGDGRLIFVKNSGTEDLVIKDYLGSSLKTLGPEKYVIVVGNDSNNWDIYSFGQDIETQSDDSNVIDKTTVYNFNSPMTVTDDGGGKVSIDIPEIGTNIGIIIPMVFTNSGGAENKWIGVSSSHNSSDKTHGVVAWDSELVRYSLSHSTNNADFGVEIYKSTFGSGSTNSVVSNDSYDNARVLGKTFVSPINFGAGDKVGVFIDDEGGNPSDLTITLYFRITSNNVFNDQENYNGNF